MEKKYNIGFKIISGEKLSADVTAATEFRETAKCFINDEGFDLKQLFNADETGLITKDMPKKTLHENDQPSPTGYKKKKERLTVMCCSNADGSFKFPLIVIGKSANPRALKNVSLESRPVLYKSQRRAWMTTDIFKAWFFDEFVPKVTEFLKKEKLPIKAVLFIDNASCHNSNIILEKDGIRTYFLPPNTTSILQPMDQGTYVIFKLTLSCLMYI